MSAADTVTAHASQAAAAPVPWPRVLSGALAGSVLASLMSAFCEASWAAGAPFAASLLRIVGLLWPAALASGVGAAVFYAVVHPEGPRALWHVLGRSSRARWLAVLAGPVALIALHLMARATLGVMAVDMEPRRAAACIAGAACAIALLCLVLARLVATRLSVRNSGPVLAPAVVVSASVFAVGMTYLVVTGQTSGGGAPYEIFGVLRRQELNLHPLLTLVELFVGGYVGAAVLTRLPVAVPLVVACAPALALLVAVRMDASLGLALERAPGLVGRMLPVMRRMADGDGDGFSAAFGGGDCNDKDAAISPSANDLPENGVDEDCSGRDAQRVTLEAQAPVAPASVQAWMQARLPKKPNILLISVDTLRWDLGYSGNKRPLSPNIDAYAKQSVIFDNAYSLASYTSKSLGPMLIGRYPSTTERDFKHFDHFAEKERFVQERLKADGLHTVSVQGYWYFTAKGYGFERGWDVVDTKATPKVWVVEGDRTVNGDKLADSAVEQLGDPALTDQQFYFWVHFVDPHAEYVPHPGHDFGNMGRERYDGEVAFVDDQVGRILAALKARPFAERTIVIFTSDHGEAFGEHGMWRHGFEVWDELVRVPLFVNIPGNPPGHVAVRRSSIDVVPTILEMVGLSDPKVGTPEGLPGVSLLPDILRPPGYEPKQRLLLVDMPQGPYNEERAAFIDGSYKLITSQGKVLGLFDLDADPGEKNDLSGNAELKGRMLDRFKAFRGTQKLYTPKKP